MSVKWELKTMSYSGRFIGFEEGWRGGWKRGIPGGWEPFAFDGGRLVLRRRRRWWHRIMRRWR